MVISQREKVEDGVRYRLNENSRWVREDGQDPKMRVDTSSVKPVLNEKQQTPRSKPLGQNSMAPPWNYDSLSAYFQAYAFSRPKTKAGKFFFDVINTANWLNDDRRKKQLERMEEKQRKAVENGFQRAMQQFNQIAGNPDPKTGLRDFKADDLRRTLRALKDQLDSMQEQRRAYAGQKTPEAMQFMSEYATYKNLHDLMVNTAREYNRNARMTNAQNRVQAQQQAQQQQTEQRQAQQNQAHEEARQRARDLRNRRSQQPPTG